jgi:hypothetical protein
MLTLILSIACAPEPVTTVAETPPAPPPVTVQAPKPPPARGRGDFCDSDAECGWDEPCAPKRCGTSATAPEVECEKAAAAPGTCACVEHQCATRLAAPATGAAPGCKADGDCAIDVGTGTCDVGQVMVGPITTTGGYCACHAGTCEPVWIDPIPCTSWQDCDVVHEPRLHPVKAVPRRTKKIKACEDSEVDAICSPEGFCQVVAWSC